MIHIDADRGDKFLKKNQIAVDVGISPLNKAIALLSYSPTTETYRISISFPDSSPLSLVDDYCWKAGKSLSDVSNFSATAVRQGGHVHWHSDGSKLIIFIHNRLHVFSFSWLDKTSEPPRYLLFPDVIFLVQSSYDAALRVPGGQIFDINQVLEVQWTVKANRRDIVGQHLFALTSSLLLLTQTDGFCLIDWHGSLLHHFPLNPLLAPAQAPEPTTPSEEVEDCRDLFRLGLLDSAVAMKSTVSPLNYELPSTSDDVALSRLDQVRSVVWLEGVQSFFLVFLDGSFALYSLPPSNSSSSTSNLLNSKVPASPQAPPTPSYYRGGAAVKKLGESALWALLTQKEELATTLAAIPINATPVIVATQPSYNPTRPPSTDVTTLPPPPPHSDVIGGVEALISQRIYFISQVAYPLTSSPSTAPVVYECSREGVYASPYITMKEVQHYCAFPPSVEKKLQRSPLLLEAKCVEEISKVNDVVSLEDLPIDALDLHSDVSIILLMTTRHFMDSDVTTDEPEEHLQHSRSSEGEDAPKPKPNLIPFMMTYSLVKVALLRSEEEESEVEAVSHSQPFSTPVKRMPNATVTSAPPLSPVRGRGRGRPQLRLRVIEVCNVARLHCLEQERYHSKLQLHYDSFQHESLLLTWIHLSVSARSTSMMKQHYFTVDLSLVSPDRPLHSSNNEVDDEEVILTKLATLSTSFLHLHHSLQHTRRSAMTFKTRVHRLPTSLHLLKPKQVNHSEVVEYDDVSRALLLPSIDQEAVQISYTETSSEGEAETEEVSRDLIRCHHSSARERVTLPKQLTQALHTHEAFCYHHSLTWHQLYSTSSSTPPLPSHRLATRATSSSLSLIPSNRLTSLSTPSLFVSISSKRNITYVTSPPSSPHPMGSAIDRQVLHLSHEVDYVACIVGRKKAAISGAGSNQPTSSSQGSARKGTLQTSVIYFCQAPELWIFNQQTKRWRNTTLLVGLKEGRARLIKSIPPVHYHLILSSGDDEEVVEEEEDQRKRQHSNGRDGREDQRAMTLSRSQSVGLDSSQYNFYLSASTLASDSTAFDDALHGLSVEVRGHNLRPASSDALLAEEHNPPTPIAQQTRHPTIVIPQDSLERGAASKPPLRRPSHTTQRGVGGAVGAMTSRRRSDSDTSKSSDVTDATSSTTTGRRSRHRLRTSVETAVTTQGGAAIAPAAATSALSHLLSPTSSSSAATSSNNHLIASSLQVVALSWFDTHTIILLTLRKSIYYIEILSREILRDVYYNANPTANANNPHYNHYSVQPKLHKLIPLPIGFIPHHHDVINIVYPIHSTSSAESNSTHSFNPLLNGQTTPKSAQPPHHSNFAVVAVSDGKHFLAYQITARFLPAPTSVSELKSSATADTPTHRRQNSGGVFGDNAVRTSMTSMNASDSAKMLDNYSFLELFNFTAEEVHTPPSLTVPLSLKTMKIYVAQVSSSERQIAVFENLRKNYGDDHYIHYVSLLIVTESNEHLLLDAPLKTATSLTPPPQTPPTHPIHPHNTPLEEVEVARLSSADFPLLHSPSSYQFNDVIAVHHPNHHTSQLRGYHHHLIDRLTHLKLLQRFGKKGNKEGDHVTPTPLSLPQNRNFLYSTAYLTSVSYDHYLTSQYLGQEAQQIENQRALLQLTLPLPLSSPPRRIENSGDEVVVEEVHGVCLLREGSAVLVSPSLSQLTSSLSKEVMKGVWPRQSTSRHSQQESLLFHLLTLLYERHRHLLIQHLLTTPSDTSSHPSFLSFPLMPTSSSLSSVEGEVAFVRQVVHSQLDFFHRSRQSSKLQHLLASLEHYAAQVIRQTTPHLLVPYTSSPNDNNQSSEKTSAKRERRQQQSHSLALPPQVEEYVRQHELYWFTSFCHELHPLLFLEVLTKLVRKLEPRQTHRLFPLCTHLSLTEHDSDSPQTTLSFHTTMTSVFEVMENALLPRHLVDYLIRYLSFLCEHVGGSDTLLHTFVCLFYVSEVFYQSIVTLALTKASDVMDFSLRLEDMLFQFNTLHQQKQQKKSSPMTSERESMKDVVMSRLETLKRHSRQSHYKHSLAMFQRLQHLLDNTTSTSTTSAQSLPQSPNGTTVWESLGVSWLLSSIGLTSSTTTSEEGSGNGVSRRRKKVVKMVQGSDVSHPSTPQPGTTSSTTFKSLELLEQFLSLERLNALLTHSLPQHPLIPPPSTPSLLEQLNTSSSTASLTKPSSLMWHLLGGVLYDWLVVQRKRLYHTVAFVLLSLLKSPKNERLLQHHLYLLLFTSPSNDDSVRRHCQQRLFPAHYDHLIGGASKDKTSDDVSAFIVERYEVVSKIFIVLRMHKYVRRIRSLSVSIDTGNKKSAESRQLLREHQLTCLDYCQQPLPQQYLKKLVDVEYHHTSFTSLKQQKGVTSAPPQQRNPSLDEQSSHSQSLHRLEASLALLEPATSASTHGMGMTSSSSLSTSVIDNRYFPLYFESPLYSPDDDDVTPLEPRQHLLDKNCFYSASLWQEYVDKISLSARSRERRHLPLHLPTDSEEADVTSMQLLRGVILAHLLVAEIHIPLMLLYDIRSLLHDDIHFLLSQLFSDEFAEDNSLTPSSSKTPRRSLSVEERMEIIQFIFLEFLFPNLQQK